jgi:deazaflavin-dependent oxidoreductase (nitroreductase family)
MAGEIATIHPNSYQRFVHRLLMLKWVSAFLAKVLYRVDHFTLSLSHGRMTVTRIIGLPMIELTTTGAKSGQPRSMPLVSLPDGDRIVLIASNFGQKHNPGWYYNLKAHPECTVQHAGQSKIYLAHEVHGAEREDYFRLAKSYYGGYEKYKQRAAPRQIPVMVLEPKK